MSRLNGPESLGPGVPSPQPSISTPSAPRGIACSVCRKRKNKCDGARPACGGCVSRESECSYEEKAKRRGPDRKPRLCTPRKHFPPEGASAPKKSPRQTRSKLNKTSRQLDKTKISSPPVTAPDDPAGTDIVPSSMEKSHEIPSTEPDNREPGPPESSQVIEKSARLSSLAVVAGDFVLRQGTVYWVEGSDISLEPSLSFVRLTWWDRLLDMYSMVDPRGSVQAILDDIAHLFRTSGHILSFIHAPTFFSRLLDPGSREKSQPSLVLACLALSTLIQSSELGLGSTGREKALLLHSAAQAALEASINARWMEPALAQAAVVISTFELCPHPMVNGSRFASSLRMLDSIIKTLGLTYMDVDSRMPAAAVFPPQLAPILLREHQEEGDVANELDTLEESCICEPLSVQPAPTGNGLGWIGAPTFGNDWDDAMIQQEQSRRSVWCALRLVAGYITHRPAFTQPVVDFYIAQASNFALLFPGESLYASDPATSGKSKTSIWALHNRATLLWLSAARMRDSPVTSTGERATFSMQVWNEADYIEKELVRHSCKNEEHDDWAARHFLSDARMCVTYDFQRFVPSPQVGEKSVQQRKAHEWVRNLQAYVMLSARSGKLANATGQSLRRPYVVWFLIQLLSQCIRLWHVDKCLIGALTVATQLLPALQRMRFLFPCPGVEQAYGALYAHLDAACATCGIPIPLEDRPVPAVPGRSLAEFKMHGPLDY